MKIMLDKGAVMPLKAHKQNAGFNSTAFLSWAKRRDMLVTDNNKRTKKARITGNPTNCICIKTNLPNFDNLPEIDTSDLPL